jgi:hypothetical protein
MLKTSSAASGDSRKSIKLRQGVEIVPRFVALRFGPALLRLGFLAEAAMVQHLCSQLLDLSSVLRVAAGVVFAMIVLLDVRTNGRILETFPKRMALDIGTSSALPLIPAWQDNPGSC